MRLYNYSLAAHYTWSDIGNSLTLYLGYRTYIEVSTEFSTAMVSLDIHEVENQKRI